MGWLRCLDLCRFHEPGDPFLPCGEVLGAGVMLLIVLVLLAGTGRHPRNRPR